MITVENRHHYRGRGIYIGRPTPLGNPFFEGTREENITKYRGWLIAIVHGPATREQRAFKDLCERARKGDLVLLCSCAPAPCHGDVLAEAVQHEIA